MTPNDAAIIAMLVATDIAPLVTGGELHRHDGTLLTDEERDLVRSARWEHLIAARDFYDLDVELEIDRRDRLGGVA